MHTSDTFSAASLELPDRDGCVPQMPRRWSFRCIRASFALARAQFGRASCSERSRRPARGVFALAPIDKYEKWEGTGPPRRFFQPHSRSETSRRSTGRPKICFSRRTLSARAPCRDSSGHVVAPAATRRAIPPRTHTVVLQCCFRRSGVILGVIKLSLRRPLPRAFTSSYIFSH